MLKHHSNKVLHEVRYVSKPGCFSLQLGHKKRLVDLPKALRIVARMESRGWYAFTAPVSVTLPVKHRATTAHA